MRRMLLLTIFVFGWTVLPHGSVAPAIAQSGHRPFPAVVGAKLRFLRDEMQRGKAPVAADPLLGVTIRFDEPPSLALLREVRRAGAHFGAHFYEAPATVAKSPSARGVVAGPEGPILGGISVVPARIRLSELETISAIAGVMRVETAWTPRRMPPLYETRTLSGVDEAWKVVDPNGAFLDGSGVLLADLDTGVDLSHPDFWRGDGGVYSFLDVDSSGDLSEGDAVDLNHNGLADPGETLRWWNAPGNAPGLDSSLQLQIDHLYQDANDNHQRDFGAPTFSDSDPCFGEALFRPNDTNGDGILQTSETVTMLSSCKVKAIWERDDTIRTLGVDLIESEGDSYGHGTNVASILLGGAKGRAYAGFAPGAELIDANLDYSPEHPFVTPLDVRMSWAAAEGADIFVYEDGEWIWEFLDGSSNVEILMNELAAEGSIHVAAAGNLATGHMHWEGDLGSTVGDSLESLLTVNSPSTADVGVVWGDFYFVQLEGDSVEFSCEPPSGPAFKLGGVGGTTSAGNFSIYSAEDLSPRGTRRVDFRLEAINKGAVGTKALDGSWRFVARRVEANAPLQSTHLNAMCWDNLSGWYGFSTWQNALNTGTVTWPGTADSSITVAAYSPQNGGINTFSGRGKRVDGVSVVDLAAPGSTTYTGERSQNDAGIPGGYGSFGGTSAATPHVAGAAALLKQWDPSLTSGEMRALLRGGARLDSFTGSSPNDTWGAGKLNVYESMLTRATAAPMAIPAALRGPRIEANVPNPFNPSTLIRYELLSAGRVRVEILDLKGRRVALLREEFEAAGPHELRWNGCDGAGISLASGIYLVRVQENGQVAARKVILLK